MRNLKAKTIQRELRQLSDAAIAAHSQRFFKTGPGEYGEGDRFLGIRVPVLRRSAKKYKSLDMTEVEKLLHSGYHEERLLALLLLVDKYKTEDNSARQHIYQLYVRNINHINNWDLVDTSAPHIVGAHLLGKSKQPLFEFSRSENLWQRRIAIISCLFFIHRMQFSTALKISKMLLYDKEDLVQKAVGWILREIGKRNIAVEQSFLAKHYQQMPRTMLRYAIEKFPADSRHRYLKGEL